MTLSSSPLPSSASSPGEPSHGLDLSDALERLGRGTVLVIGDVALDRFVQGTVRQGSASAAMPVLSVEHETSELGGAGNVVRHLTSLGAAAAFVAVVGDDQPGSDVTALIGGQPNVEPWLLVQGGRITSRRTYFVSQGMPILQVSRMDEAPMQDKLAEQLLRIARDALAATSVTLLFDHVKGVLSGDIAPQILQAARQAGRKTVIGTRNADLARFAGADVLVVDTETLQNCVEQPVDDAAGVLQAAAKLRHAHHLGAVVVMRGLDGVSISADEGDAHLPLRSVPIADAQGVEDSLLAIIALSLAAGIPHSIVLQLMDLAATVAGGRPGAQPLSLAELRDAKDGLQGARIPETTQL